VTREGGSEWEPIKILLLRENSAYTPNSQPRIPTRVCQGHVVTTDLPTLGTNPKRSRSGSTKQEAKDLVVLRTLWRTVLDPGAYGPQSGLTVRYPRADGPLIATERPASTQARGRSVPRPRTVREQLVPRGRSATSRRTVDQTPPDQKQLANRIEMKTLKNVRRTLRTPGRTAPREQSACYPQMVRQAREHQPEPETANTKAHIRPWIFQTTEALEVRFGKM
jgi:hypothetical protein